jgi:hypothetical protein
MTVRYVTGYVHLGEPEVSLWCPVCQLPARVRWPLFVMSEAGVSPYGSTEACLHCEGYDTDDEEDD